MKTFLAIALLLIFFTASSVFAYKQTDNVATVSRGFDIPIKVCVPDNAEGKLPVMFFVHGGGWNGGDDKTVPDAQIPADCNFLCDQMGIVYVGLAYQCKGNKGTFNLALKDLEASIQWFENRADEFHADMSRIGFSGGSAGTTLSAVLAQRYPNCVVYTGREGMYNVLDLDSTLSNFPDSQSRADYGLVTREQKLEASPFYQVREKPAASLLLHGKDDWLCHYTQSLKFSEKITQAGGECKVVLHEGINHTCLALAYPEVFEVSIMEMAHLYANAYQIANVDFEAIETTVLQKTTPLHAYENIPLSKLLGSWESSKYGTFTFYNNCKGEFLENKGKQVKSFTYTNNGSSVSVIVDGENHERSFYLRKNDNTIYELITENNRYKSWRNDFNKQQ